MHRKAAFQWMGWRGGARIRTNFFTWLLLLGAFGFHAPGLAQDNHDQRRLLTVWAGSLPIIIAAPHGGRQAIPGVPLRRGIGIAQFTTERDNNTAELAETLASKLGERLGAKPHLIIAHFERKYLDANRAASAAYESSTAKAFYDDYHSALDGAARRVRGDWGAGVLLDIHGQGAEAETIFRGTDHGRSVSALEQRFGRAAVIGPKSILGQLATKGYKVTPDGVRDDRERRYTGGYTTQTYGSHRGTSIDAIQLEFGTTLRAKANLERTASDLAEAVEIFAKSYLPLASGAIPAR